MAGRGGRGSPYDRDGLQSLREEIDDLKRKMANMVRIGEVEETDPAKRTARVRVGEKDKKNSSFLSDNLRISSDRAGTTSQSRQLSKGEQVILFSPDGKPENAVIGASVHNGSNESPSDRGDLGKTVFPDGTTMGMDDGGKAFSIIVPSGTLVLKVGGSSIIISDGSIKMVSPRIDMN